MTQKPHADSELTEVAEIFERCLALQIIYFENPETSNDARAQDVRLAYGIIADLLDMRG